MSRAKVAYILLFFPEPTETFVLDEVNTLIGLGLEVEVYSLYGPRSPARLAGLARPAAPVFHLGLASLGSLLQDLWRTGRNDRPTISFLLRVLARRWRTLETAGEAAWSALAGVHLARRFKARGVTHIHASWANGPATAAWVASRISGIPFSFCARAHDIYPPDGALEEKLAAARWVRTENRANLRYLAQLCPSQARKLNSIYNGVPLEAPTDSSPPAAPPFRLLALGRLVVKKGFAVLLEACRLLAHQGLEFQLTLAGAGPQERALRRMIEIYGLESRVSLPGFAPHREVPRLLAQAHLFVMPSIIAPSGNRDGTPTVILEALQHGVPVVATDICGISEMVRPGETGWLVRPGDAPALAAAIQVALSHPQEAQRRAQWGRRLVQQEFDSRKNYAWVKDCLEKFSVS
ncbi:MAG: glycosyltransferase family 4 protein [Deltaproteobacteria bacterium]|nr:glycosyltransferase family 4 protein [Deltaproteobacteria bacterium]